MEGRLDVWGGVRETNAVLRRWPLRLCLPLAVCGMVSWASEELGKAKHTAILLPLAVGLLSIVMGFVTNWAQVSVSAMYLRVRDGGVPGMDQVGQARRYPALWPTMWGLFGWYLVWGLGFAAVAAVPWFLWKEAVEKGAKGIQLAGYAVGLPVAAVFFAWVASRYVFALPLVAIRRTASESLVGLGERISRQCRGPLMLISLVGAVPGSFIYLLNKFLGEAHLSFPLLEAAFGLIGSLVSACVTAWMAVLMTQLALQRLAEPEQASGDGIVPNPSPPFGVAGMAE